MLNKSLFKRPKNTLEGYERPSKSVSPHVPDEMYLSCPGCKAMLPSDELAEKLYVCPRCGRHLRIGARQRIALLVDRDSFREMDAEMASRNIIDFPGYTKKLANTVLDSQEKEAVITGEAMLGGRPVALFVMEPNFMIGSMGTVVGEKITRLFEYATQKSLPVIGFTVSGGARMQEGILSLMQMAKTSGAVKRHSDAGNLYIVVLTDPTTGGVTASFGMEGDIQIAEPGALIGFAGPRVIEQTIRQKLPAGFQRAEFLLEKGFLDAVVPRRYHRKYLSRLLALHERGDA